MKFYRENLFIADLRYYEKGKGVELSDSLSKIIVAKATTDDGEDIYYNALDVHETYPVFERSRFYSNDYNGESYGSKMIHLNSNDETGPCWVIDEKLPKEIFGEIVTTEELEKSVLESERYFKDRKAVAMKKIKRLQDPVKMLRIISKDAADEDYMNYFFSEKLFEKVKKL